MLKKEPAVIFALVAALAAAAAEIVQAGQSAGGFDVWSAVLVGLPLVAGILTRYAVVPVETVREAIGRARSANQAVTELANRVDVAVPQRPATN